MKGLPSLSKMISEGVKGLDLKAEPPVKKLCWTPPPGYTDVLFWWLQNYFEVDEYFKMIVYKGNKNTED